MCVFLCDIILETTGLAWLTLHQFSMIWAIQILWMKWKMSLVWNGLLVSNIVCLNTHLNTCTCAHSNFPGSFCLTASLSEGFKYTFYILDAISDTQRTIFQIQIKVWLDASFVKSCENISNFYYATKFRHSTEEKSWICRFSVASCL